MGRAQHSDEPKFMCDCFLCAQSFQFGPHIYRGRPINAWGGIMLCDTCQSANWDGIVLERHHKLRVHLEKIGVAAALNEKGWLPIPPR